jgi:hypothetical protein
MAKKKPSKKVLKTTVISFLLDETGSMEMIKSDTIGGFNTYLDSLKDPTYGPVEFTLLKFDSNRFDKVCVGVPAQDVQPLTNENYNPGAMTPLIDATYKTIKATEELVNTRKDTPNVLIVIQTDGQENASTQYKLEDLTQLVKEKTAAGWGFVFLGANMDAFAQASQMGFSRGSTMSYTGDKSAQTFDAMAVRTRGYRSGMGVQSLNFSDDERTKSGDQYYHPQHSNVPAPQAPVPSLKQSPPMVPPRTEPRKRQPIVDDISLVEK